jgi:hypothetical protein
LGGRNYTKGPFEEYFVTSVAKRIVMLVGYGFHAWDDLILALYTSWLTYRLDRTLFMKR